MTRTVKLLCPWTSVKAMSPETKKQPNQAAKVTTLVFTVKSAGDFLTRMPGEFNRHYRVGGQERGVHAASTPERLNVGDFHAAGFDDSEAG
jgi:hypothetical protein